MKTNPYLSAKLVKGNMETKRIKGNMEKIGKIKIYPNNYNYILNNIQGDYILN